MVTTTTLNRTALNRTALNRTALNRSAEALSGAHRTVHGGVYRGAAQRARPQGRSLSISRRWALVAAVVLSAIMAISSVHTSLADRGNAPASVAAVSHTPAQQTAYVVQPGDTLWSIAERFHGSAAVSDYLDRLIDGRSGDSSLQIGERLALP